MNKGTICTLVATTLISANMLFAGQYIKTYAKGSMPVPLPKPAVPTPAHDALPSQYTFRLYNAESRNYRA